MKAVILVLLSVLIAVPAFAGAPVNGTYKSTDIGGLMLPGRYSELWFGGKLVVNNTLNEQSWDGSTLGRAVALVLSVDLRPTGLAGQHRERAPATARRSGK